MTAMALDDSTIQLHVGPQLGRLADALRSEPETAEAASLCDGWSVKHVIAHMTMAARYDEQSFMAELEAAGYDFDRLSETVARRDGLLPYDQLLDDLESATMAEWAPPGGGAMGALTHAVIHGLDVTSACAMERTCDDDACRLVLDALTRSNPSPFGMDLSGHLLRATDLTWQYGEGEPVDATAADLVLVLAGRHRPGVNLHKQT